MSINSKTDLDKLYQKTVCIDLDGTLAEYHGWKGWEHIGKPITEAVELVRMLHDDGVRIIVFTCRMNKTMNKISGIDTVKMEDQILMWLIDQELSFCEVSSDEGKPFAHAYVDDRAVPFPLNGVGEMASEYLHELVCRKLKRGSVHD